MTSEPDSTPRRRPPTIDLTATEVEKLAQEQGSGATGHRGDGVNDADSPGRGTGGSFSRGRLKPHAIGAASGAIVMGIIIVGLWLAGYVPPSAPAAPAAAQGPSHAAVNQLSARLDKIEAELRARQPDAALAARLTATEVQAKSLRDSLAALNRRVDETAVAAQGALARANEGLATAAAAKNSAQAGVQRSDIDALNNRIAALERAVKSLSDEVAHRPPSADDRAARMTIAAEALRAAVERGAPYKAELAAVKSLGVEEKATAPLDSFAATGVPSATDLAHELSQLTPALLQASGAAPNEGSFLGRLESHAQKLVRITPVDAAAGDDLGSIVARINADAARADIAGALADIARLPQSIRTVATPWVKKADARNAALEASRSISAAALAALGEPNPQ